MEATEKNVPSAKMKIIIGVLIALVVISACALAGRLIYLSMEAGKSSTVVVPNNLINKPTESAGEQKPARSGLMFLAETDPAEETAQETVTAATLELFKGQPADNEKFEVLNMFPGDREEKYYCVKANHSGEITIFFNVEVTAETKALADVLHIKVTQLDTGRVLCDAPFSELNPDGYAVTFPASESKETLAYYKIEVDLPTYVGNEHQAALLKADFNWYVKDEGGLEPPPTGDVADIYLWIGTLAVSGTLLIILLLYYRRKKEDEAHVR